MRSIFYSLVLLVITGFSSPISLSGDFLYEIWATTDLSEDGSEARSLNQQGSVAGKMWVDGEYRDFITMYSEEDGTVYQQSALFANRVHPTSYPVINSKNEVIGITYDVDRTLTEELHWANHYFYSPEETATYIKGTPLQLFSKSRIEWLEKIFGRFRADNRIEIKAFNDKQDRLFHFYRNNELAASIVFSDDFPYILDGRYIFAINNQTQALISSPDGGLFVREKGVPMALQVSKRSLFGVAINDRRDVIATNTDKTEGFFGVFQDPGNEKMISLGSFIPTALNNHGDVVGMVPSGKEGEDPTFWLRKQDGTLLELSEIVDFSQLPSEKIVGVFAINDNGQILVTITRQGSTHAFLLNPKIKADE